jgi:hypothetical protein
MGLSYGELESLWIQAGGPKSLAPLMAAIALAESSGNVTVVNSIGACGLWQIHPYQNGCTNARSNARMAVQKYRTQGLGAWVTYTSGAYKQFLRGNVPPSALAGGGGGGGAGGISTTGFPSSLDPFQFLLNDVANSVGASGVKDLFVRLGLILFGGLLVLVAVFMLVGRPATQVALSVIPETRAAGAARGGSQSN